MSEARFLKVVIVVLLLVNVGTLSYLWLGQRHGGHHPPPGPGHRDGKDAAVFLRESLRLSDAQEQTYRTMREQHHETVLSIHDEMKESKRALYALLRTPDSGAAKNDERRWLDSLAAQQRRIEDITYEHFRDVRALCTPQQQQKFDEVIGEALEQMR